MTPRDFVEFAGLIAAKHPHSEAARRSAVSRAYYGAFHASIVFLDSLGFQVHKDHPDTVRHLQNSRFDELVNAGSALNELYSLRRISDYRLDSTRITASLARQSVEDAEKIIRCLENCFADEAHRTTTIAAIRRWLELTGR